MLIFRASSGNKPFDSVCRRAFSERSRRLAVFRCGFAAFFVGLQSVLCTILDGKASLTHLLHAQAVPVREKAPERELLSVSKGSAFGR